MIKSIVRVPFVNSETDIDTYIIFRDDARPNICFDWTIPEDVEKEMLSNPWKIINMDPVNDFSEYEKIMARVERRGVPFTELEKDPRFINLSEENKKLVPDKYNKFLIWNIPAVETCPNATPHCIHACYARKAERMFPGALPSRRRNFKLSTAPDFVGRMLFTIAAYMSKPAYKNAKNVIFRIHESGDFYSPEYVAAWLAIIAECEKLFPNLHFMAYTKSTGFFRAAGYKHGMFSNFNLLGSVWDDTPENVREDIAAMNLPIYTADTAEKVAAAVANGTGSRCRCDDCAHCGQCIYGRCMLIYCVIH